MHHAMKVSTMDLNRLRALHFLLEEGHVGLAAVQLSITPAAASNALRRLREDFRDPLLTKRGRGLVRTRLGEDLRVAAREVFASVERLMDVARPFDPARYSGELPIAMGEHVATLLTPSLDALARREAPFATLAMAAVPLAPGEWLERTGGVLVGPMGPLAAAAPGDALHTEDFYQDRYLCVLRRGHSRAAGRWDARVYAAQQHVLVTPRGRTGRSDVDERLGARGLSRRVARIVPSFTLALPIVAGSDLITTMPERCAREHDLRAFTLRELPFELPPLDMKLIVHPAAARDGRTAFLKSLLRRAFAALGPATPPRGRRRSMRPLARAQKVVP